MKSSLVIAGVLGASAAMALFVRFARKRSARGEGSCVLCDRLFASSPEGMIGIDRGGVIRELNQQAATLFRAAASDLVGSPIADRFAALDVPAILAHAGNPEPLSCTVRRLGGDTFPAEITVSAIDDGASPVLVIVRDITERRLMEDRLRESEERLRLMSDASFEGVLVHDHGVIIDANRRIGTLVGVDADLEGTNVYDYVHPEDIPLVKRRVAEHYEQPFAFRLVRSDGIVVPVEGQGKPLPYRGRMVRVAVIRDISDRQASEQMHRRRLRLEMALANVSALFVSSNDPSMSRMLEILASAAGAHISFLVTTTADGAGVDSVMVWNAAEEAFAEIDGAGESLGRYPWWRQTMERELAIMISDMATLPAGALEESGRMPLPGAQALAAVPLTATDGSLFGYLAVGHQAPRNWADEDMRALRMVGDMFTAWRERRRAEVALVKEEEYFRSLIEHITDAIIVMDTSGTITYVSPSVSRIMDVAPDVLAGNTFFTWIHKDDTDRVVETFSDVMSSMGRTRTAEFRLRHTGGDWRIMDAVGKSFRDHAGHTRIIMNLRDITERRLLEHQLSQSQKMEAVGRLAGGVAHDFNNLMTVILGHTHMMGSRLEDTELLTKDIDEIRDSAERAADLTRQLLAFSRRQVVKPKLLDLNRVIADIEKMLRRLISENIELSLDLDVHPASVMMDPGQVEQVLMNLVVNARDAMPGGGTITVTTARTRIEGDRAASLEMEAGAYVALSVADTGTGMDEEVKKHIFEPFFTTKEVGKGTGLGLATVYGIITQASGRIMVDTSRGRGTVIQLYVPAAGADRDEAEPPRAARSVAADAPGGTETVMLVEDDTALRTMVTGVLTESGYTVIAAGSGDEAMRLFAEAGGRIDVLLTDMVLPGAMTGPMVADSITMRKPSVRVLFMSGYADADVTSGIRLETGKNFIQKPFVPAALLSVLRACIDRGRERTER